MSKIVPIETDRLILRQWQDKDLPVFAKMNSDAEVMRFYPEKLQTSESDNLARYFKFLIEKNVWGFWAVELKSENIFIGFTGLNYPRFELPVKAVVEIGWRLGREHWGNGYATEAGRASIEYGFQTLDLKSIYSFTSVINKRSIQVMKRLGMKNLRQNFAHPIVPKNSPLSEHVLYRIDRN